MRSKKIHPFKQDAELSAVWTVRNGALVVKVCEVAHVDDVGRDAWENASEPS